VAPSDRDKIDLSGFANIQSLSQVLALATQVGDDTVIDFGNGDTLTLSGVVASGLTASQFIFSDPPCFCRGTLILTDRGEVAVEDLAVGNRVRTLSGALKPIIWIGLGRGLVTRANRLARPVVVRAGALADNVPQRDLYLTHGHALYFDGVLIPVENLVNHRSIRWDDTARVVEYYHIELADHDVVFAQGAPAETYYDANNHAFFQNTREGSKAGAEKPTCAPVLNSGETVETVWAELFERAGGHLEHNTTDDPDIHLRVDGERLDPATTDDGVYSFVLEHPPAATLLFCSRRGVPSLLGLGRGDHRPLGVAVRQLVLCHAGIPTRFDYDGPQFREGGCHLPEDGYCWTDGEFELPARFFTLLNGAFTLTVHTEPHYDMRYSMPAALAEAA
jgi:Hint domain